MFLLLLVSGLSVSQGFLWDTLSSLLVPDETVCYAELGCFNNGPPFYDSSLRPFSVLPQSPDTILTEFVLYTRASTIEEIITATPSSIRGSYFDENRPTKFIVHGFTDDGSNQWLQTMKDELLRKGDMNVIIVDWSDGATLPYSRAAANTRVVGAQIAQLVYTIMNVTMATAGSFHIIGHSLGSHVAGYAGERVPGFGRITGLDPANPFFQDTDPSVRLDPTDAVLVDVIHTDGTSATEPGFGAEQPMGHVDFYPNGGDNQPGCGAGRMGTFVHSLAAAAMLDYNAMVGAVSCSHGRVHQYFIESINSPCPFTAYPCSSAAEFHEGRCLQCNGNGCSQMGYNADKFPARGSLYLETEGTSAYCDYTFGFNLTPSNDFYGRLAVTLTGSTGTTGSIYLMRLGGGEFYSSGSVISKLIRHRTDIGDLQSITVQFDAKFGGMLSLFRYPTTVQVAGLSVWSADRQIGYYVCDYGQDLPNQQPVTFELRASC